MPPNQVQIYIQHLVNAFLIHKVARYDLVGKRIFEIGEKFYFENLGQPVERVQVEAVLTALQLLIVPVVEAQGGHVPLRQFPLLS